MRTVVTIFRRKIASRKFP